MQYIELVLRDKDNNIISREPVKTITSASATLIKILSKEWTNLKEGDTISIETNWKS